MSTFDDTPSLPARLFQLLARLDALTRRASMHAATTAVYIDLLGGPDSSAAYLEEADRIERELALLLAIVRNLRRDVVAGAFAPPPSC
jgi:hypothetical protein